MIVMSNDVDDGGEPPVPPRLVTVSVWADLRHGRRSAELLLTAAPRLGVARVLIPMEGELAPEPASTDALARELIADTPAGVAEIVSERWSVAARHEWQAAGPADNDPTDAPDPLWIPTWPQRRLDDLLAKVTRHRTSGRLRVDVPVSIGRTVTEAAARAAAEPVFTVTGHPREQGLFGTLEDAQQRILHLAAAGVSELCCVLPAADLLDHLAQLSAATIGDLRRLQMGSGRSADPPPPMGWGGPTR